MFDLQRYEKFIIISLILMLLLGVSAAAYRKSRSDIDINVKSCAIPNLVSDSRKININEAGPAELMKIKGIGKALAGRIVEYRANKGIFASIDDIKNVKGIGPVLFEKIKDRISVE